MDTIIKKNGYTIQHGEYNDRIYIMKMAEEAGSAVLAEAEKLVETYNYGKLFAKVPASQSTAFEASGFVQEGMIPDYYSSGQDVLFMSKFNDSKRSIDQHLEENENVLETTFNKTLTPPKEAPQGFDVIRADQDDAVKIADLYRETFSSYPFPIYDPEYIKKMMSEDVDYYLIIKGGVLAAVSSAEKDPQTKTSEMTDFATKEEFQGNQLATVLLKEMEKQLTKENYRIVYTIARSGSIPMNVTFARLGYAYSGRLVNNTNISGGIESMNIWYKNLQSTG